jgi:hypothetical protein
VISQEFYYTAGLLVFFGLIGLAYASGNSCQRELPCDCCAGDPMCWWVWSDGIGLSNPNFYFYNCYAPVVCPDCGAASAAGGGAHSGDCCAACAGGDCCTCAAIGEDLFAVLVAVVIILIALGVVISVAVGAMYISFIMQRHVKVLKKWNLAQEFMVVDLCENEDGLTSPIHILEEKQTSPVHVLDEKTMLKTPTTKSASGFSGSAHGIELYGRASDRSLIRASGDVETPLTARVIDREMPDEEGFADDRNPLDVSLNNEQEYETHPSAPQLSRKQFDLLKAAGLI